MKHDDKTIDFTFKLPKNVGDINTLTELCLMIARELLETTVQILDDELLEYKPKGWRCVGKRTRTISTRIGEITIKRRFYVKATKGKNNEAAFCLMRN